MSFMNVFVKYAKEFDFGIFQILFFRSIVIFSFMLIYLLARGINPLGNQRKTLLLRGLFGSLGLTFYFLTVTQIPLATAVSIQYLSPIFTTLLAIYINKQRSTPLTFVFYAVAFSGVLIIRGFDARVDTLMLLTGLASAFFSGMAYNMIRRIGSKDKSEVIVFYFPLVTLPLILWPTITTWQQPADLQQWAILLGIGGTTLIGQLFMTKAYQHSQLSGVAIFQYFGLLYALGFGYYLFGEKYSWLTLLGMALIVAGAISNALVTSRKKKAEAKTT